MKNNKKYIYSAFALATIATLAMAVPALADDNGTQTNTPSSLGAGLQGHIGVGIGMPGRGNMRPAVVGTVSAISGNIITVSGKTFGPNAGTTTTIYTVDVINAKIIKAGVTGSLSSIAIGDTIVVQGTVNGMNVTATMIRDGVIPSASGMMKPAVVGKVTAVSGNTITVSGKSGFGNNATSVTYTVDATNATVMKNGATSFVSSIAVGDTIVVQGTLTGTNLVATMIRDGVMPGDQGKSEKNGQGLSAITGNGEPIVAGSVTAISGNIITITNKSNVTYTIDATNAKISKGPNTSTISSVAVGDMIVAQGTVNGNSVVATSVIDQTNGGNNSQGDEGNSGQPHKGGGFFGGIGAFFAHIFGF